MITIDAISITASAITRRTETTVIASSALIRVRTTCKIPAIAAADTPNLPIPAATPSSLRLEVSFLSSSSLLSVNALLIFPNSELSPITVATIYPSPEVTTEPMKTFPAEE